MDIQIVYIRKKTNTNIWLYGYKTGKQLYQHFKLDSSLASVPLKPGFPITDQELRSEKLSEC